MANQGDEEIDETGYKAPAVKSFDEIRHADEEDESLRRYKETLLGKVSTAAVLYPNNPNSVVLDTFTICVEEQPEIALKLSGDLKKTCSESISIPEGSKYRIKVEYFVQRDIVTALQYDQSTYRGPVRVDRSTMMLGSYAPQSEKIVWRSEEFEAPKGAMHRGHYKLKSRFRDIDKHIFIEWEWSIDVTKGSKD